MKKFASVINGRIMILNKKQLGYFDHVENFVKLPDEEKKEHSVYPVVTPTPAEGMVLGQLIFDEENQVVTYTEVPAPPPPTPEQLFQPQQAITSIHTLFKPKAIQLAQFLYMIEQNCNSKNFTELNVLSQGLLQAQMVTNEEYDSFLDIFAEQNINLIDYTPS